MPIHTPFASTRTETPINMQELVQSIAVHVGNNSKYSRFQRMYKNDRIAFVYDCIPSITLASYQEEVLGYFDEGHERVSIRGPHGLGKTLIASVLTNHAVLTADVDTKVPTTASAWRQLEKYLWPEIHKTAKLINWATVGRDPYSNTELLVRSIKTDNAEAFALSSNDETTLEGAHATRVFVVFDEAKAIDVPVWDALEGVFSTGGVSSTHEAYALSISTPGDPSGRFYDIQMLSPGYEDWKVRHVTVQEAIRAGRISEDWVEQRRRQWGESSVMFQNRVLGQFADESEDGVIPLSWVQLAVDRYETWEDAGSKQEDVDDWDNCGLGVDVARMGQDSTLIAARHGLTLSAIRQYSKVATTVTTGYITLASNTEAAQRITIEGDHLGSGVYDQLHEHGHRNCYLLVPGGKDFFRDKTGQLEFLNNRTQMWWNMRELLDPDNGFNVALPNNPRLIGDLIAPKWSVTSKGVIQLEPKKDIIARIGHSPDFGDACCLAFWSYRKSSGGGVVF